MTTLSCILYNSEREEIKEKYVKILLDYGPDLTIPNAWVIHHWRRQKRIII